MGSGIGGWPQSFCRALHRLSLEQTAKWNERCAVGTGEVGRQEVGRLLKGSGLPTMGADGSRKTRLLAKQFSFHGDSRPRHCN